MTNNDFIISALNQLKEMDEFGFYIKPSSTNSGYLEVNAQGYKYLMQNFSVDSILSALTTIKGLYAANNWMPKNNEKI